MKNFKILAILIFSSVISFYSCKEKTNEQKQETKDPMEVLDSRTKPDTKTPDPATVEPPQNAVGVWHYTCSKGCAGGAGSAVNCDTCGGLLAHNSAYHTNSNSTPSTAPYATPPPPAAEPNQNSAGVWHYTCGKGCAGGGGAAGNCGVCGGALSHNTAYHQ